MKFKVGDIIKSKTVPEILVIVLAIKDHWTNHKTTEAGYELIILNDTRGEGGKIKQFQRYGLPESLAIVEYDLVSNKPSETPKDNK